MNCSELQDDYEMHALGLLSDPERSELEEHLRRGCPSCIAGMQRALSANALLLSSAPPAEPARGLRDRVLAIVGAKPRRSLWLWLAAPAAALAGLAIGVLLTRSPAEQGSAQAVLEFLRDPDTQQATFAPGPRGRVFVNKDRGVLLIASHLPALSSSQTLELWTIPKGGAPKPAGVFKPDSEGRAVYFSKGAVEMASLGAVAVSVEPEGGSPAPTTTPIIVAPLGIERLLKE